MIFRTTSPQEFLALWQEQFGEKDRYTREFFLRKIEAGEAQMFTCEEEGKLIAELYAFTVLEDADFAQKGKRAYLCAFRVKLAYRGQGIGSQLMRHVLSALEESGYTEVTIAAEDTDLRNIRMYERFGFTERIKHFAEDPCSRDRNMRPMPCEACILLVKR